MRRQSLIYTAPDIGLLTVTDSFNRTYQFVTSSNTGIDGVITGLILNPFKMKEIIGVLKAYTTRVGAGPLPTDQLNKHGDRLQFIGREFGVTTRAGWI